MKKMKNIARVFVFLVLVGTVFSSCTTVETGPVDMSFIQGKWNLKETTATSSAFTIPYTVDYLKNEEGCNKDYIEILSGGIVKYGDYTLGCVFEEKSGTWTQSGNTITIEVTNSSFNGTFDVASLSAKEMLLRIDGTYSGRTGTLNIYFTK